MSDTKKFPLRLGILGSTRGSILQHLVHVILQKQLEACIELVVSNKVDALILEGARQQGLKTHYLDPANLSREAYDQKLSTLFQTEQVERIVLMGYMRILSKEFVTQWPSKIINVHPSLLPDFAGKMDLSVHRAVLESGAKETGCTVHYVTEQVDSGPILLQKRCPVFPEDTAESLKARVQQLEGEALVEALCKM